MLATTPNHEQLTYFADYGYTNPTTNEVELTNPSGTLELQRAVDEGRAKIVGSNVVGASCDMDYLSILHTNPENFRGNLVVGRYAAIEGSLELVGCVVHGAKVSGSDTKISNATFEKGTFHSGSTRVFEPTLVVESKDQPQVVLDPNTHTTLLDGKEINLTNAEFALLLELVTYNNRILSREQLSLVLEKRLDKRYEENSRNRVIDVHMSNIRKKLQDAGLNNYIRTKRSIGFGVSADTVTKVFAESE